MITTSLNTLKAMGIQPWILRNTHPEALSMTRNQDDSAVWAELEKCVKNCILCPLHKTRTQTVFGVGNQQAELLIIGEAPGAQEDQQGEPFVGRAGSLLNEMLAAIGLSREQVFIANILKCRPPNNRDPQPEEVSHCIDYLTQQIALLKPKLILTVGRISAQNLLNRTESLGQLRNHLYHYHDIPVIVTYHPAYLLRSPRQKRQAYQDLLKVREYLT